MHYGPVILRQPFRQYQLPILYPDILYSEQVSHIRLYSRKNSIYNFLFRLCVRRDGSGYFLADIQHLPQTVQMDTVTFLRSSIEYPKQQDHQNKTDNHKEQQNIQLPSFTFQSQVTAFQLLVLTGIFQDIQINITVVV